MSDGGDDRPLADWLKLFGFSWPARRVPLWSRPRGGRIDETHASRALRRFLEILRAVDNPVLLDLGLVSGSNVTFFGRELGGRLIVHDLFSDLDHATRTGPASRFADAIERALNQPADSVDGVVCWDVCDYLEPDDAKRLVAAVARVLKPGGTAFAVFSTVLYEAAEFTRFTIEDPDHLRHKPQPGSIVQHRVWSSRDIVRAFAPLRADETYLLSHGEREVLFRKARPGEPPK